MNARREYESRLAAHARSEAYHAQRADAAAQRFTRDDAGMAYGADGALERAATAWLGDPTARIDEATGWDASGYPSYQWDGRVARSDDALAMGGYDVLPDSLCHIDGAPSAETESGTFTTIAGFIYATDDVPALMRERPDGVHPSDHNKFVWRNVRAIMVSDTLGVVNPRRVTLGGRNRRDGRNLVRTALAVGVDGAALRIPADATAADVDAAYAYALDTARAMRLARLAHRREQSRTDATARATDARTGRAARHAQTRIVTDAHTVTADLARILAEARESERIEAVANGR